jgi:hypothetical protein
LCTTLQRIHSSSSRCAGAVAMPSVDTLNCTPLPASWMHHAVVFLAQPGIHQKQPQRLA